MDTGLRSITHVTRVLFVDHTPFVGGAELALASHIEHLDRRRFTPFVACTDAVPALVDRFRRAGATVHTIPMNRLRERTPRALGHLVHSAWKLRRLIHEERIDLVVSNTSRAAYVASVAILGTDVPLIWWVRDFLFGDRVFSALRWIPRAMIGVSRAIRRHYGGDERFRVVYVGSDIHRRIDAVTPGDLAQVRKRWGIASDEIVIGFMGRLVAEKGPQDLLAAVCQVHERLPKVRLLFVGTGEGQEGNIEEELREDVARRGLGFVSFAGYQMNEALYYRLFDVFVLSTRTVDAYATSVVQAMMAGTPVVATDAGGTCELVRDGVTGLLVAPGDPDALARALTELVGTPDLAHALAVAGQAEVMQSNREEVVTAQAEAIYQEILGLDR